MSCGSSGVINIWNIYSGLLLSSMKDSGTINCIQLLDEDLIVVGVGSSLNVWDISRNMKLYSLTYHKKKVQKIILMKDLLISCGFDSQIVIYDLNKCGIERIITTKSTYVRDFTITKNFIISCGESKTIEIFNISDKKQSYTIDTSEVINRVISDGIYIIGIGSKIHLFSFEDRKLIKSINAHKGHISEVLFYGHLFVS